MKYITTIGDERFTIDINQEGQVTIDGQVLDVDMRQMLDTTMYSLITEGKSHDVRMREGDGSYVVHVSGEIFEVVVEDERTRRLAGLRSSSTTLAGEITLKAPMPGVIVEVRATPGQSVEAGELLVIMESMKMQNEFKAPRSGKVHNVKVVAGDKVEQNTVMVSII